MKFSYLLCLLIAGAAATAQAEDDQLESVRRPKWIHKNYQNERYGISVSVRDRSENEKKEGQWGQTTSEEVEIGGTKVSISTQENEEQFAEIRVPLDTETIEYLFSATNEPEYVRFIAASRITASNLPESEQLRLLKTGIRLPDATLRYYIWHDICEFKPREEVSGLLHLSLRDPCIDIAHHCLGSIIKEHELHSDDGSELKCTTFWRGSILAFYTVQHREIHAVAKALHRKQPDLMPQAELDKIRDRAMPSDAWFEVNFGDKNANVREYFRDYVAKTKAE